MLQSLAAAPRPDAPKPIGEHRLEEIDVDGRQFCSRCGTADAKELEKPCPAISDGEMYKFGNRSTPTGGVAAKLAEMVPAMSRCAAWAEEIELPTWVPDSFRAARDTITFLAERAAALEQENERLKGNNVAHALKERPNG